MTLRDLLKVRIARGTAIFGSIALCATVAAAQGHQPATPGAPPAIPGTPGGLAIQSGAHDGELLAQLIAVDENEVRAAKEAEDKKVDTPILNFAKMLHEDHMKDLGATQSLAARLGIDLKHSAAADQLHDKGTQMISRLDALKGDAFDKAFVTEMINGHKEALRMLDDAIRTAQNDQVREHLTAVRQTVAMHLRSAEALQSPAGSDQKNQPETGPDERAQYQTAR